jgi:hypothetical protein
MLIKDEKKKEICDSSCEATICAQKQSDNFLKDFWNKNKEKIIDFGKKVAIKEGKKFISDKFGVTLSDKSFFSKVKEIGKKNLEKNGDKIKEKAKGWAIDQGKKFIKDKWGVELSDKFDKCKKCRLGCELLSEFIKREACDAICNATLCYKENSDKMEINNKKILKEDYTKRYNGDRFDKCKLCNLGCSLLEDGLKKQACYAICNATLCNKENSDKIEINNKKFWEEGKKLITKKDDWKIYDSKISSKDKYGTELEFLTDTKKQLELLLKLRCMDLDEKKKSICELSCNVICSGL